jgi:hypothetical protein
MNNKEGFPNCTPSSKHSGYRPGRARLKKGSPSVNRVTKKTASPNHIAFDPYKLFIIL